MADLLDHVTPWGVTGMCILVWLVAFRCVWCVTRRRDGQPASR